METSLLLNKFQSIGARVKFGVLLRRSRSQTIASNISFNIAQDKKGEFFEILMGDQEPTITILDVQPRLKHLLLLSDDPLRHQRDRLLCGHDERHWFVASVPPSSTVLQAMEALKPTLAVTSQMQHKVKTRDRHRRRNAGFLRQGEWFFIPISELDPDEWLVLNNEPITRGNGKAHRLEFAYREGGTTVYVCSQYPAGLTNAARRALFNADPEKADLRWQTMIRDPILYAKGWVRHPDHKTIMLSTWHRVLLNKEVATSVQSGGPVAFLD